MNELKTQIMQFTREVSERSDGIRFTCVFPKIFIGFSGHFPGRPVLPGVCFIQAVMVMLYERSGRKVGISEILLAKFNRMILPDEEIVFNCVEREGIVDASVTRVNGEKVASIKLVVGVENSVNK